MVYGGPFLRQEELVCAFAFSVVSASWKTSSSLECISPASPSGSVALEISNNNQDFTTDGHQYGYFGMYNGLFAAVH